MTLQQVAAQAGVSTPTISRVLNGRPDVAPATREKVLQVLRDAQYMPRGASAVPGSTQHIELVFDALDNPNNQDIMRGVTRAATEDGTHVAISTLPRNVSAREWVNELGRAGRAGLIIVTSRLTAEQYKRLEQAALPLVLVDPVLPVDELPSVGVNNWHGGVRATQHLLDLGHRRIGMLRGYKCLADDARYQGYVSALTNQGIAIDNQLVSRTQFRFDPAESATLKMLSVRERPTAIFAANDIAALGAVRAARTLGLGVPDDLSVVGFDDSVYASIATPGLTTIRQPFSQIGQTAYRILVDQIRGRAESSGSIELAATLIVRESTAVLGSG